MNTKIKIAGHIIHRLLASFPVAFYAISLACYIAYYSNDNIFWFKAGYIANAAGVGIAALTTLPGFIDWLYFSSRSKLKTELLHMFCNMIALVLFWQSWWMQCAKCNETAPAIGYAILLTAAGFLFTLIAAGLLGSKMPHRHHTGVNHYST
jgi:uncharacterized membrane protein